MSDNHLRYSRGGRDYIYRDGIIFDVSVTDRFGAACGLDGIAKILDKWGVDLQHVTFSPISIPEAL